MAFYQSQYPLDCTSLVERYCVDFRDENPNGRKDWTQSTNHCKPSHGVNRFVDGYGIITLHGIVQSGHPENTVCGPSFEVPRFCVLGQKTTKVTSQSHNGSEGNAAEIPHQCCFFSGRFCWRWTWNRNVSFIAFCIGWITRCWCPTDCLPLHGHQRNSSIVSRRVIFSIQCGRTYDRSLSHPPFSLENTHDSNTDSFADWTRWNSPQWVVAAWCFQTNRRAYPRGV